MNQEPRDFYTMEQSASNRHSKRSVDKKGRGHYACTEGLNNSEANRLIKSARKGRERRLCVLFIETGMHPSVLQFPAPYDAVDSPDGHDLHVVDTYLYWYRPKTDRLSRWEIPGWFREDMQAILDNDLDLKRGTYWSIIKRVGRRCGLTRASPLCLRHTATRMMAESRNFAGLKKTINASKNVLADYLG